MLKSEVTGVRGQLGFLKNPNLFNPNKKYSKEKSLLIRPMIMMYWHNNLGIVNQAFNELLSYEELEAERIILKDLKTGTRE